MKRVPAEIEHLVIRHHLVDKWPIGTIARELCVHHDVVRRILRQQGQTPPPIFTRRRMVDPYLPYMKETLQKYPNLHASRLYQMVCQRGFEGSPQHFRRIVAQMRPRPSSEPFARLNMLPAEQGQVDWGHFGKIQVGRAQRPLYAFVITLSWSRMVWLQFFHDMHMASFQRGHVDAFEFFGGVPRSLLYDNLKSAVLERVGSAIRFNTNLLELASYYGFEPKAAAPRRGNEKGRVERSIRYIRTSFFAARDFKDIGDLNQQAREWSLEVSAARSWPDDDSKRVGEQFSLEKTKLRSLPPTPFEAWERSLAKVGRTPYVRFDTNDYSLPATHVRREVLIQADHQIVRVLVDGVLVAQHNRSYDRRCTVSNPEHHKTLLEIKRRAKNGAGMHRLTKAAPAADLMLKRAAQRGQNLGSLVSRLLELLDTYGAKAIDDAMTQANAHDRVGFVQVRMLLEQKQRLTGKQAPVPIRFANEALKELTVQATDLAAYDQLIEDKT